MEISKVIIALILSFIVYFILEHRLIKKSNKKLDQINKTIIDGASLFYNNIEIDDENIDKFKTTMVNELCESNLMQHVKNFSLEKDSKTKINVSYLFSGKNKTIQINYSILRKVEE